MHGLVIRRGTLPDGTGAPRHAAAIHGDRIAAVSDHPREIGPRDARIDADGLLGACEIPIDKELWM